MERLKYLDYFKVLLALMVVGLHAEVFGGRESLLGYLLVNGVFRIAVPVYFLINGYFLQKSFSVEAGLGAWFYRVFWLYVVWALVYLPFYFPSDYSFREVGLFFVNVFVGYWHLWYLVATLLGGVFLYRARNVGVLLSSLMAIAFFLVGWSIQVSRAYGFVSDPLLAKVVSQSWVSRNFLFVGFPFLTIGALIFRCQDVVNKIPLRNIVFFSFLGLALLLCESFVNYQAQGLYKANFDVMLSLLLVCPAVFLVFLRLSGSGGWADAGKFSSALYLVHPAVLLMLSGLLGRDYQWYVPVVYFVSAVLALVVLFSRSRIRFLL